MPPTAKRIERIAAKLMKILIKEDVRDSAVALTLCLSWALGAESDRPLDEIDHAVDETAIAIKKYARNARQGDFVQ